MQNRVNHKTRRDFVKDAARAGAVIPAVASSFSKILGANDRVRIGILGAGGRSMQLASHLLPEPQEAMLGIPQFSTKAVSGAEVVAAADVYEPHLDRAAAKLGPRLRRFQDYRKLLEQNDIDAVIIGSPDHWHTPMAIDALEAGKDVYLEKPVTHSIEEGPKLIQAVEKTGRIFQGGTQQRSWKHYLRGKEIIDSGRLGTVRLVESYWFLNYLAVMKIVMRQKSDVSKLDWNAWLGAAPAQPFSEAKFRRWRYFWDFGGGALADLMTHAIDTIQWYMDSPAPSSAIATGHRYDFDWECPDTVSCTLEYPKGFLVTYTGQHSTGMDFGSIVFRGSKGTLEISRAALMVYDEPEGQLISQYNAASHRWRPEPKIYLESDHEGTADNLANWLDAIRTRKSPNVDVRVSVEAARAAHLGNAALRGEKKAVWDQGRQTIVV